MKLNTLDSNNIEFETDDNRLNFNVRVKENEVQIMVSAIDWVDYDGNKHYDFIFEGYLNTETGKFTYEEVA
jgi:uncharacterized protein YycO